MQCRVIEETLNLHDCPKIKKFHLQSDWEFGYNFTEDPVSFAVGRGVEELILILDFKESFELPNSVFNLPSLVRLHIYNCTLMPDGTINWKHLKDLYLKYCCLSDQAIQSVLSGSPLLESLEIKFCVEFDGLVIASKSLKKLVLEHDNKVFVLQVSCPNLVEFSAKTHDFSGPPELSHGAIESLVSSSPSLEKLELDYCEMLGNRLVIDSKSLRKLVLDDIYTSEIVISCPNLEELQLYCFGFQTIQLMNLPSLVCVTVDCNCQGKEFCEILGKKILEQLHDVKELNGRCFLTILTALEIKGIPSLPMNVKCMTFDGGPNFVKNLPGIAYGLRISPELEKLVIISREKECETDRWLEDAWL